MNEDEPRMTPAQLDKAVSHLQKKVKLGNCPMCSTSSWFLNDMIIYAPGKNPKHSYPMIVISCQNCSYILSFSAVGMGLLEGEFVTKEVVENGGN